MLIWQMSTDLDAFQAHYKNKASFFNLEEPPSVHSHRPAFSMNINEKRCACLENSLGISNQFREKFI